MLFLVLTEKWLGKSLTRYQDILSKADKVTYVSPVKYFNGCMMKRNNHMIDNSSLLIAVYNGSLGSTKQTIEKAKQKGLQIQIVEP